MNLALSSKAPVDGSLFGDEPPLPRPGTSLRTVLDLSPAPDPVALVPIWKIRGFHLSSDDTNIIELLGPGEVIGQAIGLLMTTHDVSRDAAFAILVQGSTDAGARIREFAAAIIENAHQQRPICPGQREEP